MQIQGKKVFLRAIEEDDLCEINSWANDPGVQNMLASWHFPVSTVDQKKWFSSLNVNSDDQRFAIESYELGLVGTANLVSIDWKNRTAFHGVQLGVEKARGKGYAHDAVMTIMQFAFNELDLERLDGSMIEYNHASLKLYLKYCGWVKEGVKEKWYYRNGRRWDKIIVGITRERYIQLCKDTNYWDD